MIGNTPLEVAQALVGSVDSKLHCWVSDDGKVWRYINITKVVVGGKFPFSAAVGNWLYCSLTDPNKIDTQTVCPDCYGDGEVNADAVDANDRYLCDRCAGSGFLLITEPQTRTMTAFEMIGHVEKNRGILVYQRDDWPKKVWVSDPSVGSETEPSEWRQAKIDDPNFPQWEKLPEVEV